jgi:hypothetical protein
LFDRESIMYGGHRKDHAKVSSIPPHHSLSLSLSLSPAPKITQKIVHRLQSQWRIKTNFQGRNCSCPLHHGDDDNLPIRFWLFREFDGTSLFLDLLLSCFNFLTCWKSGYQWSQQKVKEGGGGGWGVFVCMNGNLHIYNYGMCLFCDHTLTFPKQTVGLPCCAFCTNQKPSTK